MRRGGARRVAAAALGLDPGNGHAGLLEQAQGRLGRLRALREPVRGAFVVDDEGVLAGLTGVVVAQRFQVVAASEVSMG